MQGTSNALHTAESYEADFETAVTATKLGKFNILLFLIAIPAGWAPVFATTTMSYVLPAAHCDLKLSLTDKGTLNAITFGGMICSGVLWGFLCDTLGRKKILVAGYFLDAATVILSAFSQNRQLLIVTKFFGGLIVNGCFSALAAYLSEFHRSKYRVRVQLGRGIILSCGTVALPLLAWVILPYKIDIELLNGAIVLHAWNIYLLVCALPSLISGVIFIFMPESPKFLMTTGRNEEALNVFRMVYSLNTGQSKDSFWIKHLVDEPKLAENNKSQHGGHVTANRTKKLALKEGIQQIKPICFPPHLHNIILVCSIQGVLMMGGNTLRLWLPQIFQSISDYELHHNETTGLCTMLQSMSPKKHQEKCEFNFSSTVYIITVIISAVNVCGYVLAGLLASKFSKKWIMGVSGTIAASCAMAFYWASNKTTIVTLAALIISQTGLGVTVVITIVIDLFPTTLRTMAVSLVMTTGRGASMIGNLLFPRLLHLGCGGPFFFIGGAVIGSVTLSTLLPNTERKPLL